MERDEKHPKRLGCLHRIAFLVLVGPVGAFVVAALGKELAEFYHRANPTARPAVEAIDQDVMLHGDECDRWYPPHSVVWCLNRGYERELVRVNSRGFFGPEVGAKPPGTVRIVTLGGSTSAGVSGDPLRFGWPEYLEEILRTRWGDTVDVVNAAITGYASKDLVTRYFLDVRGLDPETLEIHNSDLEPDVVVIYSGWNDLGMALLRAGRFDPVRDFMTTGDETHITTSADPWIRDNLAHWRAYRAYELDMLGLGPLSELAAAGRRMAPDAISQRVTESYMMEQLRLALGRPLRLVVHPDQSMEGSSPFDSPGYSDGDFERNIDRIVRHAAQHGAIVAITLPPHAFGCREFATYRHPGQITLRPRDRHRLLTHYTYPFLSSIAAEYGSVLIDHPELGEDRLDRCALFADEMHLEAEGLRRIAARAAIMLEPAVRNLLSGSSSRMIRTDSTSSTTSN